MPQRTPPPDQGGFSLPMQTRALPVPTIDEEKRSVDLVWTAGARVLRYDWNRERYYEEELSTDSAHIRLGRLNGGAPLLNAHWNYSLNDQIGVVERAWMESNQGRATVRFSGRDDVEPLFRDVRDGIIRNVSVGYRIHRVEMIPPEAEGGRWVYRAVDWEPYEISLVPVPADAACGIRSDASPDNQHPTYPVACIEPASAADTRELPAEDAVPSEETMPRFNQKPLLREAEGSLTSAGGAAPDESVLTATRAEAVKQERARQAEIRSLAAPHNLGEEFVRSLVDGDATVDAARGAILSELARRSEENPINGRHFETVRDQTDVRRARMTDAIMVRAGALNVSSAGEAVREYRGMTLADLAAECVEAAGGKTRGMTRFEIVSAAFNMPDQRRAAGMHSTSDFPILLSGAINRTLRDSYANVEQTWLPLSRQTMAPDFREMKEVSMGDFPDLLPLGEGGEYKSGTIKEYQNGWRLGTFARKIAITRQAIINDDLGVFGKIPRLIAQAAARTQNNLAWAVIIKNQKVSLDGVALFHASHGNYNATAAALDVDGVSNARKVLRKMKSQDGTVLELKPRYLIVGSNLETDAERLLASVTPRNADDVNPFSGRLAPIIEPRLDDLGNGNDWFVAVDPSMSPVDILIHAYLEGNEGLYTETKEHTDVDGVELLARMDFGVCAGDYRGIYRQTGA